MMGVMKPLICVWGRNMINATRTTSSFAVWKSHICENSYLFHIEMDKYVPLHALHLSISWPAHLHMYLCRFLRELSHTAGVSECHGFSVWICASLCLVLSMCVCKCARVCRSVFSIYLFSRSFCWCLFLHVLYFIMCVYIYMCDTAFLTLQSGPQLPDGAL